jgi:hypothetical protein
MRDDVNKRREMISDATPSLRGAHRISPLASPMTGSGDEAIRNLQLSLDCFARNNGYAVFTFVERSVKKVSTIVSSMKITEAPNSQRGALASMM